MMRAPAKRLLARAVAVLSALVVALAGSGCATGFIESPPTNVTDTSATLNGAVASNRSEQGRYWFEYGTSPAYDSKTPERTITYRSNVKHPVAEPISGLEAWTEYHYRLCARDNDPQTGAHCSKDATFTTSDPQITLGPDRPRYSLHVEAADGDSTDPQSGVANVTISVDGQQVDAKQPGCSTQNCELSHDWSLNAADYAPGPHTVTVRATDGVGRTTTRELDIEIQRDTVNPSLRASGPLRNAPEGWVDQRNYALTGEAADSGYGITSLELLIDGQGAGAPATRQCPDGGCALNHTFTVDTSRYGGGAHEAALVATDGAGNKTTRSWTLNVNPEGTIPTAEAIDTLEAAGETSDTPTVGAAETDDDYPGTADGIGLEQTGTILQSTGTAVPTTLSTEPSDGATVEIPGPAALSPEGAGSAAPEAIEITPTGVSANATNTTVTTNGAAAVSANTAGQVDTVTRPLFDGAMTFQIIRDATSPQNHSWRVDMDPDMTLRQVDPRTAQVTYPDGTPAITIVAQPAHDATGATVPTTLNVDSPNGFTLTVAHQGGGFVYPILAGPGWEAAYIAPPPPGEASSGDAVFGAPTPNTSDPAYRAAPCDSGARPSKCPQIRRYNFTDCLTLQGVEGIPPILRGTTGCNDPDYPDTGIGPTNKLRLPVFGHFHYLYGEWVKVKPGEYHCEPRGSQARDAARVGCPIGNYKVGGHGNYYQDGGRKLWMFGYFIFGPGYGHECEKIVGYLPSRPGVDSGPFPGYAQRRWADRWKWLAKGVPLGQPVSQMPLGDLQDYCGFTKTLKADSSVGDIGPF